MNSLVSQLKQRGLVWQASAAPDLPQGAALPFPDLDKQLPQPVMHHRLIEIQSLVGIGELRLLLPSLAGHLKKTQRQLAFIAPPYQLSSDALHYSNFDLSKIWVIPTEQQQNALWAAEQCLRNGCCLSVIAWLPHLSHAQTKRLVLAAQEGQSHIFVLRPLQSDSLGHGLCLQVAPHSRGLTIEVKRSQGGWPPPPFDVDLNDSWPMLTLPATINTLKRAS
ncbi:Cell division inhibitor SulA [Saliniradius amylolyticus]|uniref:Cell division inhibitor SulA n=1 Tax=Saliniradius amylolyticus TaxID=2183582 RepID=A0A2S2DZV2_9ALTE|nr:recombinase RecA [Saliniradius amylolyticus]AWL10550.1 Cell division inhibitor SulA [Saliniradius amylolyticus]